MAGEFEYTTRLSTGWAHIDNARDARMTVDQRVTVYDTEEDLFYAAPAENIFTIKVGDAPYTDKEMNILSVVSTAGDIFIYPIMFATSMRSGQFQHTTHNALAPSDPLYDLLFPTTGGDINWAPGEAIQATWVGGKYLSPDPNTGGLSVISANSYSNLSTGERTSAVMTNGINLNPLPDPDNWLVEPFGPTPVYYTFPNAYPSVVTTP